MKNRASDEVICLSQMTAKEGKEDKLLKALQILVQQTLNEHGCIAYELWQDLKNPRSIIVYERFQNQEALEEHIKMPYIQDFIKNEYATCVETHWDADLRSLKVYERGLPSISRDENL